MFVLSVGGVSAYPTYNATFDAVEGPEVQVLGEVNFSDNVSLFPDNNTFQAGGHAVFTANGDGSALKTANITATGFTEIYVKTLPVPVVINHTSKQVIEIDGDLEYLEYRDMEVDDGNRDFTYNGTTGLYSNITIHGLPVDETIHAIDMDTGDDLAEAHISSQGVGEFSLPNSEHNVSLERLPFLDVNVTNVGSPVIEENTFNVTVNVTNTGYADGNQEIELDVPALGVFDNVSVNLSAQSSTMVNLTGSTVMGDGGETYPVNVSSDDNQSSGNVSVLLKPLADGLEPPLDLKDNDLHRDTDGNELLDANDVQVFFDYRRTSETVEVHPTRFDFNGLTGITIGDVQSLWIHIFTPPTITEVNATITGMSGGTVSEVSFNVSTENQWNTANLSVYNDFERTDLMGYTEITRDGQYTVSGNGVNDYVFVEADITVPDGECIYTFLEGDGDSSTYPADSWETC